MQRVIFSLLLIIVVCVGCGPENPQAPRTFETGIIGQVFRGPTAPVCVVEDPCEEPFAATFYVYKGVVKVADFETGSNGKFALEIGPGNYVIVPDGQAPIIYPEGQQKEITVPEGTVVRVRLDFDTGIQ